MNVNDTPTTSPGSGGRRGGHHPVPSPSKRCLVP